MPTATKCRFMKLIKKPPVLCSTCAALSSSLCPASSRSLVVGSGMKCFAYCVWLAVSSEPRERAFLQNTTTLFVVCRVQNTPVAMVAAAVALPRACCATRARHTVQRARQQHAGEKTRRKSVRLAKRGEKGERPSYFPRVARRIDVGW